MKILQIAPAWISVPPKDYGGTELVISNLVKGLVEQGEDVTLFATGDSITPAKLRYVYEKGLLEQDIPWTAALPQFIHYFEAFKLAEEEGFDLVHAHLSSGTDLQILAFLANCKVPCILTIHSNWPFDKFSRTDQKFIDLYASSISTLSISKTHQKTHPREFNHVGVLNNSLEIEAMEFNDKPDDYLTWLGRIFPFKGLYEAIIVAKATNQRIIFAGTVDKFKKESIDYFKDNIEPLIDNQQVIYLGPASFDEKNKMLKYAKGFLNPINWEEPFGMVMIESLSVGTPVISFNRGAASEIVKDGKNGFLVSSLEEMQMALEKLPSINRKFCREYVKQNFSHKVIARQALKFYRDEISRRLPEVRPLIRTSPNVSYAYFQQLKAQKKGAK